MCTKGLFRALSICLAALSLCSPVNEMLSLIECLIGEEIPVEDGPFDVKDNDDSIPDEPASVFSPGVKEPNYKITVRPKTGDGSEPLIPMVITPTRGDNLKDVVVRIFPADGTDPTEIVVSAPSLGSLQATK